jgi:hypothetical protein
MMHPHSRSHWLLLFGLLAALAPSHLAAGLTSKESTQRSQEIEQMTAIDRDRLQRNWKTFLALPEDRKQHFQRLHQQLEDDRKTGGGQLHETLQTYALWLQTLTPGQRADLRDAKDPAQKMELVKKFKEAQDQRQESRALDDPAFDPSQMRDKFLFGGRRPRQGGKPLESQELRAAMQALAGELPRSDRDEIEALDKVREKWIVYRRVLEHSLQQADSPRDWPTPQQQQAIRTAIGASDHAERLEKIEPPPLRRMMFVKLMVNSLLADLAHDSAPYHPKKGELEELFERLDRTEREQLMQLPAEDMTRALLQRFLSQNQDAAYLEFVKQRREFQDFARKAFREAQWGGRFGPPPGGGDRPPHRPGGPPPGGPEDDGGPRRPPRDRGGDRPRPPERLNN